MPIRKKCLELPKILLLTALQGERTVQPNLASHLYQNKTSHYGTLKPAVNCHFLQSVFLFCCVFAERRSWCQADPGSLRGLSFLIMLEPATLVCIPGVL